MSLNGRRVAWLIFALAAIFGMGLRGASAVSGQRLGNSGFVYGGSANGEPFALWVSADRTRVTGIMFNAEPLRCTGGYYDQVAFHEVARIVTPLDPFPHDGHYLYTDTDRLSADGTFRAGAIWNEVSYGVAGDWSDPIEELTGRIDGDRAAGTFRVSMVLKSTAGTQVARCATGTIHWSARSARGEVFAGTASAHPVVLELSADHRRVSRLLIELHGGCVFSGPYDTSAVITDLPIHAHRVSLADDYNIPAGGPWRQIGRSAGTGTVRGTRASGFYREFDRYDDNRDQRIDICHFHTFRWSAVSTPTDFTG
jgi:hypothetical protein